MLINDRGKPQRFDFRDVLFLLRFPCFLLFSEVELAVIQNLTYRRLRIRGHTVQIKILIICQFKGFTAHHNAQLFAILSDNKDFMETDVFVYQFFRYISFRSNVLQVYLL